MRITRGIRPERDFAVISNQLLRDASLSFRARGVLCYVLSHQEGYQMSSDRLVDMGAEGRDAIRSALTELESAGYLQRTKYQDELGHWSTSATISDTPDLSTVGRDWRIQPATGFQASVPQASVFQALKEDKEEEKKKMDAKAPIAPKISFDGQQFQDLTSLQIAAWSGAYPAIHVPAELLKAASWLDANPANKKSDYKRFLNGWLSRAQDKAPAQGSAQRPAANRYPPTAYQVRQEQAANFFATMTTQGRQNASQPKSDNRFDDRNTVEGASQFIRPCADGQADPMDSPGF